jgi:hypothetical protein
MLATAKPGEHITKSIINIPAGLLSALFPIASHNEMDS